MDIQDGVIVLIPQPKDIVQYMAGLHREVWNGINTTQYLNEERAAWSQSNE